MSELKNGIPVYNMTNLFKKELVLYGIQDVRFQQPVKISQILYFILNATIFSLIIIPIFGIKGITLGIIIALSYLLSSLMIKPIFSGRRFFPWLKILIQYQINPKEYYDNKISTTLKKYRYNFKILNSRKTDYLKLYQKSVENYIKTKGGHNEI